MYGSVVSRYHSTWSNHLAGSVIPLCSRSPISTMGRVITVGPSKGISKYRWVCNSKPNGDVWSICSASATNRPLLNHGYQQLDPLPADQPAYQCHNRPISLIRKYSWPPKSPNQGLSNLSNSHNPEMGQSVRWESKKAIKSAANFFSMFRLSIIQMIWVGAPCHIFVAGINCTNWLWFLAGWINIVSSTLSSKCNVFFLMIFLSQEGLSRFQTGTNHQYHQFWTAWLMPSPTDPPAPHSEWAWSFCLHRFCGRPSGTGPPNKCSEKISVAGNRFKGCEACQNRGNKATTFNLQQVICKSPAVLLQWKNDFSDHLDVQLSGDSPLSLQVGLWVTLKPCAWPWFPSSFEHFPNLLSEGQNQTTSVDWPC